MNLKSMFLAIALFVGPASVFADDAIDAKNAANSKRDSQANETNSFEETVKEQVRELVREERKKWCGDDGDSHSGKPTDYAGAGPVEMFGIVTNDQRIVQYVHSLLDRYLEKPG